MLLPPTSTASVAATTTKPILGDQRSERRRSRRVPAPDDGGSAFLDGMHSADDVGHAAHAAERGAGIRQIRTGSIRVRMCLTRTGLRRVEVLCMDLFTAVVTTGIYCRRGCGGNPDPRHVRRFDTAAAAEAAGYRAVRVAGPTDPRKRFRGRAQSWCVVCGRSLAAPSTGEPRPTR